MAEARLLNAGDCAVVVEFGNEISDEINRRIRAFSDAVEENPVPGMVEMIPTFRSVLVQYDPSQISYRKICRKLEAILGNLKTSGGQTKRIIEIPVCYEDEFALDLADVAEHAKISPEEVIQRHCAPDYLIYMLGFLPGFAYLGGLDQSIVTPRLSTPRTKIPAGSVGIGGEQTGIYPLESPGGWRLIGKTPVKPYDPNRPVPILYNAGDYIRFKRITRAEFGEIEQQVAAGAYQCKVIEEGKA